MHRTSKGRLGAGMNSVTVTTKWGGRMAMHPYKNGQVQHRDLLLRKQLSPRPVKYGNHLGGTETLYRLPKRRTRSSRMPE
jgi:hypothetical protein